MKKTRFSCLVVLVVFLLIKLTLSAEDTMSVFGSGVNKDTTPPPSTKNTFCEERLLENVPCNPNFMGPKYYSVNCSNIVCVSPDPIIWKITFNPLLLVNDSHDIPYTIESKRVKCPAKGNENDCFPKRYVQSTLVFNDSVLNNNSTSVEIICGSIGKEDVSWFVNVSQKLNISSGFRQSSNRNTMGPSKRQCPKCAMYKEKQTINQGGGNPAATDATMSCSDVTLIYDYDLSSYACMISNNSTNSTIAANYLNCTDWAHCQLLIAQKPKRICEGTRHKVSDNRTRIWYCINSDQIAYWSFIKNHDGLKTYLYTTAEKATNTATLKQLVKLDKSESDATRFVPQENPIQVTCSAPKFVALKWFDWKVIYYVPPEYISPTEACICVNLTEDEENYVEKIECQHPSKYNATKIKFNCTVYLQSGGSFWLNSTSNYTKKSDVGEKPSNKMMGISDNNIWYGVVGGLAVFLILLPLLIFFYWKIQRQQKQIHFSAEEVDRFMKGTALLNTLNMNKPQSATVMPYDMSLEIPRNKIKIEPKLLGEGAFGKVMKGRVGVKYVAIKTINKSADGQYFRALLSELKIMTFVGKHENIVELVGANTERIRKKDVLLIFEFCENGNALTYIRERRDLFVNQLTDDFESYRPVVSTVEYENKISQKLCSESLIRWAMEIANGMDFIASKNVYHGDLAARNILLSHSLVAKVGDFGLAKELKDYSLYVQRAECPLPLKWMSIESLRDLEFSIQSDIWSYGITLWEIFSLGSNPYPGVDWNFQSWKRLWDGERMDRPTYANQTIYDIMNECWLNEPKDRPSFDELKDMFTIELGKVGKC